MILKIRTKDKFLLKLDRLNLQNPYITKLAVNSTCKLSRNRKKDTESPYSTKPLIKIPAKTLKHKAQSKSEEKYSNCPNYQIFLAKHPQIKLHIQKFIEKRNNNKSNTNSPQMPPEYKSPMISSLNDEKLRVEINEYGPTGSKRTKNFKEDDKSINLLKSAKPSVLKNFLGPVIEENKEHSFETISPTSSSSSNDECLKKNDSKMSKKDKEELVEKKRTLNNNENLDNFEEEEINLKKGYMSDENDSNTTYIKRNTFSKIIE